MKRSLWAWAIAGALIALIFAGLTWMAPRPSAHDYGALIIKAALAVGRAFLVPGTALADILARFAGRPFEPAAVLVLSVALNSAVYAALGWTAWMGRHRSSVFYVLSGLIMTPFALSTAVQVLQLVQVFRWTLLLSR